MDDAYQDDTELWLVQIPNTELGPNDLLDKQWRMRTEPRDGKLGRFFNSRGQTIEVLQQKDLEGPQTHAFVPISSTESFAVRKITQRVSFVRRFEVEEPEMTPDRVERPTSSTVSGLSSDVITPPPKRVRPETERHTTAGKELSESTVKERKKKTRRLSN